MTTRILRRPEVLKRTGIGKSTLYRELGAGTFPRPVRIGKRAVGWLAHEVEDWIMGRERAGRENGD